MKVLRINNGRWLSVPVSLIGSAGVTLIYLGILENINHHLTIILWIILSPIVLTLWTGRRILEINITQNQCSHYLWILGRKWNIQYQPFFCHGFEITMMLKETSYGHRRIYILKALGKPHELELIRTIDLEYLMKKQVTIQQKTGLSVKIFVEN